MIIYHDLDGFNVQEYQTLANSLASISMCQISLH